MRFADDLGTVDGIMRSLVVGRAVLQNSNFLRNQFSSWNWKHLREVCAPLPMAAPSLMSFLLPARASKSLFLSNGLRIGRRRALATAASNSDTLPLAGIRVLDMTRVLAGVSPTYSPCHKSISLPTNMSTALLHPNPWRPRVCYIIFCMEHLLEGVGQRLEYQTDNSYH